MKGEPDYKRAWGKLRRWLNQIHLLGVAKKKQVPPEQVVLDKMDELLRGRKR